MTINKVLPKTNQSNFVILSMYGQQCYISRNLEMRPHIPWDMWMWVRGMRISKGDDTSPVGIDRISKFRDMWHYSLQYIVNLFRYSRLRWLKLKLVMYILGSDEILFTLQRDLKRYRIRTRYKNFRQSLGTTFN
jgi:hypothetical protein